ncbi:sigma-70 family RNA polymerase sigma factor [Streptomyces sp. NPDC052107]|uniref:sigma-70 family RNA polymerase sigma factor n=1 Tax=Streptomyces sp. NPDC052107 TaxID=3155632 RepID=UPI00341936E0
MLRGHRERLGTRKGTRALGVFRQAVLVLRWFVDGTRLAQLARDNGISVPNAYRYLHEGLTVLADHAPDLSTALERAAAAEDLVQETLERACRTWRRIAVADAPDAYVRRIMVNLANDRWRRFRRTVPDRGDRVAPGNEYGQVGIRDQLVHALRQLPMRMRTVVVLRYFHDLSDAEIAADLDISPSTVRS